MLDRRGLLLGAAGLAARPAWAQDSPPAVLTAPEESPIEQAALDVLPNLVTRMSIAVDLNGQSGFRFVVDTGANRTAIADDVAQRLGLPAGPTVLVNGVTAAEPTPTALLGRLHVAGATLSDMVTPVIPRHRLGVDGLLGVDALGRFAVTFDVAAGELRLARRRPGLSYTGGSRLGDDNRLQARQRYGQLTIVDVRAEEVDVTAFIDSGSQYSIGNMALYRSVATRRPDISDRRWTVPVIGATGQSVTGDLAVVRSIRMGSVTLNELPVIFCDIHAFTIWRLDDRPALLLGADMLRLFDQVTVDFPRREVRLGRPTPPRPGAGP